ncbi:Chitinase domain-containing protein 1 [Rhynchospora pubera]|uniref:Chitinase domain-containing protein 1 n=1 Tax=Rhynchospora pubera TaxID=906938 RepID=A0AAV8FVH4_9POAL|nr:Chitinase domain-containing protein 1 [Rhynchospora pubera]
MPPRRRDRRKPATSTDPVQSDRPDQADGSKPHLGFTPSRVVFLFVLFLSSISLLIIYLPSGTSPVPPATVLSVYERGLVTPDISYKDILAENERVSENRSHRHFVNPVLAYVTPWNSKGYDMAKVFNSKFTHISPVWYQLKSEGNKLILQGQHDVDLGWISELRKGGNLLVVPRILLEAIPAEVLVKKKQLSKAIDLIIRECQEMGFDGIVLESWLSWAAYGVLNDPELRMMALNFIKQLGETMHSVNSGPNPSQHLQLILVISPVRSEKLSGYDFGPEDLKQLADSVDGFSLMTYDFSSPQKPGPNAPLEWIKYSLGVLLGDKGAEHAHMIFLGINFYGNDFVIAEGFGGGPIIGREFISLLEKHKPALLWEKRSSEHYFSYMHDNVKHAVFFPTLMSISARLDEARAWGTGLSIWEIGQGLDYFFDLL